ncbi:hypothetical protein Pcinc_027008 [Petrolisthes cinctipes]|uniref:Uncharacterized protein n=1 Tax=Petrolisthes cinctipes TaxID=88211 RepID=A0AAE1F586_PETCI|nr:hypothetical protein Pcinc_027008 [Petrolisthes cinctipes]
MYHDLVFECGPWCDTVLRLKRAQCSQPTSGVCHAACGGVVFLGSTPSRGPPAAALLSPPTPTTSAPTLLTSAPEGPPGTYKSLPTLPPTFHQSAPPACPWKPVSIFTVICKCSGDVS